MINPNGSALPLTSQSLLDCMAAMQSARKNRWVVQIRWDVYFMFQEYRWRACHFIAQRRRYHSFGWRKKVRWIDRQDYSNVD